jgi:hypothetical protein
LVGLSSGVEENLMSFDQSGFLQDDDASRIAQVRERYAPWFAFIDRLNRVAMSVLSREVPRVREELYVATLYARAVSMFQGVVRLAERGMGAEARTLVRACAETAIALGCVRLDPTFPGRLDEDHDRDRIAQAHELMRLPESDPNISPAQRADLRRVITEVSSQYPQHPRRIKWAGAAVTAAMTDLYFTVYRQTSGDAAHVSLRSLDRHVAADSSGTVVGFRFHPDIDGVPDTLSAAIAALLHASEAKLRGLADAATTELRTLALEWSALVQAQDAAPPGP